MRIRSATFTTPPRIAPNYLATEEDRRVAADSLRVTRRIVAQPALARYSRRRNICRARISPATKSWCARARNIATTIFHPVGTARMGAADDPAAVVDSHLRVRGIAGLRVVDASIMPTITSGNTNSPTLDDCRKGRALDRAPAPERGLLHCARHFKELVSGGSR